MLRFIAIVLLLFTGFLRPLFADCEQDSLLNLLKSQSGTDRIQTLIELSNHVVYAAPNEGINYADEALELADESGEMTLKFKALTARGYGFGYAGKIRQSMTDMQACRDYYASVKDSVGLGGAISDLGYLYQMQGLYDLALEHFQLSLSIREKIGDKKGIAYTVNNIGGLYWRLKKFDESLEYHLKAIAFFESSGMDEETGISTANLGEIYFQKGMYDEALKFLEKARKLNRKLGHTIFEASNLNIIGKVYLAKNNIRKAIGYFNWAINLQNAAEDKKGLAQTHLNLGRAYMQLKKYSTALENFNISIDNSKSIHQNELQIKALNQSATAMYQLGLHQQAYLRLEKAKILQDSIFTLQQNKQVEELKIRYDTEKQLLENANLKQSDSKNKLIIRQQRFVILLVTGSGLLVLLSIWLLWQRRRSVDRLRVIETEQKLLRSQMNPHFIFNTITVIQNFVLKKSPREAVNLLSSLASIMRLILENSSTEFVPAEKEIKTLELYLQLQQQRFGEKFDYQINTDTTLTSGNYLLPPMMAQPFIENAIEHGFSGINYKGNIRISYRLTDDGLLCEVDDNGIGYESGLLNKTNNPGHHSYGIEITRQRIHILKKKFRLNARVEITDKIHENGTGTLVKIFMPVKQM